MHDATSRHAWGARSAAASGRLRAAAPRPVETVRALRLGAKAARQTGFQPPERRVEEPAGLPAARSITAVRSARERGGRALLVGTDEANTAALRVYKRAGFAAERPRWRQGRQLLLRLELS